MSCKETESLVADYLDSSLPASQRRILEQHMQQCEHCRSELAAAQKVSAHLLQWRQQQVPQWNRIPETLRHARHTRSWSWFAWWQWAPVAVSLVLVLAIFTNVQLTQTQDGFVIAFGANRTVDAMDGSVIAEQLARFEVQQRLRQDQEFQALAARMEERQDASNIRLMETVISQMSDSTARSLDQVLAYFEAIREQDMQILQSTYQQLVDSDYETIRSVQQLASYVQYQP
ncbi:MAG: zf-HC2 domain-containing protein [Gammaproteobacteria bacterium]|nr:zf-HC2 domain-containing protein [Gammaproteobacteria bacterium]MDP2140633.1 zf-HC2 domain-containing protein [Gammaproteobacteria bacterium]MDP2347405.1 zf-HC2 domain-containing protein [Gammaproteobacteria bacterium]